MVATTESIISKVRGFNRFITKQIGVLEEGLLQSPYSLTESRILFELGQDKRCTASQLTNELGLDAGYLSRTISSLERRELIRKVQSETDARQRLLRLTEKGLEAFEVLNKRSEHEVGMILGSISQKDQQRLINAMDTIQDVYEGPTNESKTPYFLRSHQPGDMGWIIHRHGVLYSEEYNWDESFEALVAEIVATFVKEHDPSQERAWIAEMDGQIVGSIFVTKGSDEVAKLRLLYVEPNTRGSGLGTQLVKECIRFARNKGYKKLTLWTNDVLLPARHIYQKAGFQLVKEEPHHSFGHDLIGETWDLEL